MQPSDSQPISFQRNGRYRVKCIPCGATKFASSHRKAISWLKDHAQNCPKGEGTTKMINRALYGN